MVIQPDVRTSVHSVKRRDLDRIIGDDPHLLAMTPATVCLHQTLLIRLPRKG